jgi:MFS family permease
MTESLRPIASLLLGVAFLLTGSGLQFTLLPLRGSVEGFGNLALGAIASAYYFGFVSGCFLAPVLILRAGHIRAFATMVAIAAAVALAYALAPTVIAWIAFRSISGLCVAGIYLVVESWLNDHASNDVRGFVMSVYVIVNFAAFTTAQMLVALYPVEETGDFMIAAMLCSIAIVPVALTRSAQPAPITLVRFRPYALYRAAPVALVGSFVVGSVSGAFWGLAPLSTAGSGLDVHGVAFFMSASVAAGALAQWPIGRLSDRVDRRLVLFAVTIGAAVAGVALWLISASGTVLFLFGFVFGALALPAYSLAAAHAYDSTAASEVVPVAATILLANGLGAVMGPVVAALVMSAAGPRGLFLFTGAAQLLLAGYVLHRIRTRASLTTLQKAEFDLAATAEVGSIVTPTMPDPADPAVAVPDPYVPPAGRGPSRRGT